MCDFETQQTACHLAAPRLSHDPGRRLVPPIVRPILRALRVADFLEMRVVSGARTTESVNR